VARTLDRALRLALGFKRSPLKAARRLVLDTRLSTAHVAERSGFSSIAALSRAFRREFGQPPSAARRAAQRPSP